MHSLHGRLREERSSGRNENTSRNPFPEKNQAESVLAQSALFQQARSFAGTVRKGMSISDGYRLDFSRSQCWNRVSLQFT